MLHYASGAPANDDVQVVENQLARQRLFSVHPDHTKPLRRWVKDVRASIHSFRDQLKRTPGLTLATRLGLPFVQRRFGNPFVLRKLLNGHVVRRKHPRQHRRFSFQ